MSHRHDYFNIHLERAHEEEGFATTSRKSSVSPLKQDEKLSSSVELSSPKISKRKRTDRISRKVRKH